MKKVVHEEELHNRSLLLVDAARRRQCRVIGVVKGVGTGYVRMEVACCGESIRSHQINVCFHIVADSLCCSRRQPRVVLAERAVLQGDKLRRNKRSLEAIRQPGWMRRSRCSLRSIKWNKFSCGICPYAIAE